MYCVSYYNSKGTKCKIVLRIEVPSICGENVAESKLEVFRFLLWFELYIKSNLNSVKLYNYITISQGII